MRPGPAPDSSPGSPTHPVWTSVKKTLWLWKYNLGNVMTFKFQSRDLFIDGIMTSIMECERPLTVCSGRDFITFHWFSDQYNVMTLLHMTLCSCDTIFWTNIWYLIFEAYIPQRLVVTWSITWCITLMMAASRFHMSTNHSSLSTRHGSRTCIMRSLSLSSGLLLSLPRIYIWLCSTLTVSPSLTRTWELSEMNFGVGKLLVSLSASFSTALAPS